MTTYPVTVTRSGEWWAIHAEVPGTAVWTQCRRLEQAADVARDAIALALDEPEDAIEVTVTSVVEARLRALVDTALALSALADQAQHASSVMNVEAARTLRGHGLSVRDTGALMALSSQRISQLVPGTEEGATSDPDVVRQVEEALQAVQQQVQVALTALASVPDEARARRSRAG